MTNRSTIEIDGRNGWNLNLVGYDTPMGSSRTLRRKNGDMISKQHNGRNVDDKYACIPDFPTTCYQSPSHVQMGLCSQQHVPTKRLI